MNKISDFFGILFDISKRIFVGIFKFFPWLFKVDAGYVLIDTAVFFVLNYFIFKKFEIEFFATDWPYAAQEFVSVLYVSLICVACIKILYEVEAANAKQEARYKLRGITIEKYFATRASGLVCGWIFAYVLMMFFLLLLVVPRLIFHF